MLKHFSSSLSLLIVEDEKDVNDDLAEILKIFFAVVDQAFDGEEALEKYKTFRYDIILTDINMPKVNGIVMSRKIKALNPEQVIMVVSAHSETKYMIELIDLKIDKFILKPFDKNTLFYKLLKISEYIAYQKEFQEFYRKKRLETVKQIQNLQDNIKIAHNHTEDDSVNAQQQEVQAIEQSVENYHYSHKKEDAEDFMNNISRDYLIWSTFKDDITELLQLSEDFAEDMDRMELDGFRDDIKDRVIQVLNSYIVIFSTLDQMARMTEVLGQLVNFLYDLDPDSLTDEQQNKMKLLSYINDDITRFLQTVFVYKDTVDIYYLEDSLESSILQLKNQVLGTPVVEDEDDDLELF